MGRNLRIGWRATVATLAAVGLAACGDNGGTVTGLPASTSYSGVFADPVNVGTITLTFASPVASLVGSGLTADVVGTTAVNVTGSLVILPAGTTIPLTGTIDNGAFSVSGGGYTLTGTLSNGQLSGTLTGPDGDGAFQALAGTNTELFCGIYMGTDEQGNPDNGDFYLVRNGAFVKVVVHTGSDVIPIAGSVVNNNASVSVVVQNPQLGNVTVTASGSFSGASVSGTYMLSALNGTLTWGGTWSGSTAACSPGS